MNRSTSLRVRARSKTSLLCFLGAMSLVTMAVLGQDRPGRLVLQEAPLDAVVAFPEDELESLLRRMSDENIATLRMLEGGEFNVNIRRVVNAEGEPRMLTHADTIDLWIVQEGSGTLVTGEDKAERAVSEGDMVFIPAGIPHGVKTRSMTWFNIRFPEHRN